VCFCRNALPLDVSQGVLAVRLVRSDVGVGQRNRHQREADCAKLSRIKKIENCQFRFFELLAKILNSKNQEDL